MKKPKQVKTRKEPASVTIGNLELQNRNLEQRCADLMAARDNYQKLANQREIRIAELSDEVARERHVREVAVAQFDGEKAERRRIENEYVGYARAVRDITAS